MQRGDICEVAESYGFQSPISRVYGCNSTPCNLRPGANFFGGLRGSILKWDKLGKILVVLWDTTPFSWGFILREPPGFLTSLPIRAKYSEEHHQSVFNVTNSPNTYGSFLISSGDRLSTIATWVTRWLAFNLSDVC